MAYHPIPRFSSTKPDLRAWAVVLVLAIWLMFRGHQVLAYTITEDDYRFYVNLDAQTETDPWPVGSKTDLAEDASITASTVPLQSGDQLRIRLNVTPTGISAPQGGAQLGFQYATGTVCSTATNWTAVGAVGSASPWRFYDNPTPVSGSTLTTLLLSASNVKETYNEANPLAGGDAINDGQTGEWDVSIQDNGATPGQTYCFRATEGNGTPFATYNNYPQLITKQTLMVSQSWRWYDDETDETPISPLAAASITPMGLRDNNIVKLRWTINEVNGASSPNEKFKLQYSTSSGFAYAPDVAEKGNCTTASPWCYGDGVDADGDPIKNLVLTDSTYKGTHNESGTTTSTFTHPASTPVEYEFTVVASGTVPGTRYYFRPYDVTNGVAVPLNGGPAAIQSFGQILQMNVSGLAATTKAADGYTTNINTTANSIPFGTLVPNVLMTAAQRITVTEDGLGYEIYVESDGPFRTADGKVLPGIVGSNASPVPWGYQVSLDLPGIIGYHTDDDVLAGQSTRFAANDTWAPLTTDYQEIAYTSGTANQESTDILFRVVASTIQPAGSYQMAVTYVVVPTY